MKKNPCGKECPRRAVGCAVSCPDWAEYVKERNKDYEKRKEKCKQSEAVTDGFMRCGKKLGQK